MITEAELKQECTPDVIKKVCELAEGFEWIEKEVLESDDCIWFGEEECPLDLLFVDPLMFSTLIRRAIEGWNKKFIGSCIHINITHRRIESYITDSDNSSFYEIYDYQSENLTHAECAMLHCLIEILKE
jgi:hypothetical protein